MVRLSTPPPLRQSSLLHICCRRIRHVIIFLLICTVGVNPGRILANDGALGLVAGEWGAAVHSSEWRLVLGGDIAVYEGDGDNNISWIIFLGLPVFDFRCTIIIFCLAVFLLAGQLHFLLLSLAHRLLLGVRGLIALSTHTFIIYLILYKIIYYCDPNDREYFF